MSDLGLPAAATDLNLGVLVIDRRARPYVDQWYNDTKRVGDTPLKFLLRAVYTESLRHRARGLRSTDAETHRTEHQTYADDLATDETTLLTQIESILP
jgi:hypothetical protein